MKVTVSFFKERRKEIVLYAVLLGTFASVSYLYDVRMDMVEYAFLLSVVWLILSGVPDYIYYVKRHKRLLEIEQRLAAGSLNMPDPLTLLEEDYQRMLEKLDEAKLEAESAERIGRQEMLDYYSMWVHQIKTPIAAMHVLLQALDSSRYEDDGRSDDRAFRLDQSFDDGEEEQEKELSIHQYMRSIKMELLKVEQYVGMVLTYLRMEDMSSDLSFEIYSLDSIIRQAVRKYSQMFILKKVRLEYISLETKVLTDEKWLVFVLEQILSNALKYTLSDGCISIYMENYSCLVIEDNGIGICPEDLPRVFEKGFTGYNGRTDKKSTGIGLYLCKSIMDKLRHRIWVESEVGQGTKVYLSLARETIQHE